MPKMDGYSVLSTLRQNPLTAIIPFIFLTGSDTRASVRKGMDLGADDYVTKPSTLEELVRAIASRLRKQAKFQDWCATDFNKPTKRVSLVQTSAIAQDIDEAIPFDQFTFPSDSPIKKSFRLYRSYYHQGITLSDVAVAVGYSPAYLTNRVAKQTGETVNDWIVKRRMAELVSYSKILTRQSSKLLQH